MNYAFLGFEKPQSGVIFVVTSAIVCLEVQRTGTLYLPVRCTSVFLLYIGLQILRGAAATKERLIGESSFVRDTERDS